jgi:hypothetical protein
VCFCNIILFTHPYSKQSSREEGCCNSVLAADETLKDKQVVVGRAHVFMSLGLKDRW